MVEGSAPAHSSNLDIVTFKTEYTETSMMTEPPLFPPRSLGQDATVANVRPAKAKTTRRGARGKRQNAQKPVVKPEPQDVQVPLSSVSAAMEPKERPIQSRHTVLASYTIQENQETLTAPRPPVLPPIHSQVTSQLQTSSTSLSNAFDYLTTASMTGMHSPIGRFTTTAPSSSRTTRSYQEPGPSMCTDFRHLVPRDYSDPVPVEAETGSPYQNGLGPGPQRPPSPVSSGAGASSSAYTRAMINYAPASESSFLLTGRVNRWYSYLL